MISATDRIYFQPTAFVARPHGLDGRVHRIRDGLVWFTAYQVMWRDGAGGVRKGEQLVPVDELQPFLNTLPEAVRGQADRQLAALSSPTKPLAIGARTIRLTSPQVMGIINATPDSFSDGGAYENSDEAAINAGFAMGEAGAAIIDVGGESTRPGAPLVWEGDEINRVQPVITALSKGGVAVSVDTRKAAVMEAAIASGAGLINDISALGYDERALGVAQKANAPVVLMHAPSQKSDPHEGGVYADTLLDIYDWLAERGDAVAAAGIARDNIIVDPGVGFGKGVMDNLALINGAALFHTLGCPLLIGASRKRLIGALDNEAPANERLGGSIALHMAAVEQGAQIIRAHDVPETVQAIRVWQGMRDAALTAPFVEG